MLRSQRWFAANDEIALEHRAAVRAAGFPVQREQGRPIIALLSSISDLNPCNVPLSRPEPVTAAHRRNDIDGTIREIHDPVVAGQSMVVVYGKLASDGAILKAAAATPALLQQHRTGRRLRQLPPAHRNYRQSRPEQHGRHSSDPARLRPAGG